jgi:hypothetical protein
MSDKHLMLPNNVREHFFSRFPKDEREQFRNVKRPMPLIRKIVRPSAQCRCNIGKRSTAELDTYRLERGSALRKNGSSRGNQPRNQEIFAARPERQRQFRDDLLEDLPDAEPTPRAKQKNRIVCDLGFGVEPNL